MVLKTLKCNIKNEYYLFGNCNLIINQSHKSSFGIMFIYKTRPRLFILNLEFKALAFYFSLSKWVNQILFHFSLLEQKVKENIFHFHFSNQLSISTLAGHWGVGAIASKNNEKLKAECGVEVWKFCQRLHLSSKCGDGSAEAGSP